MANGSSATVVSPIIGSFPDWVNWVSFGLTVAGVVISVVGLLATYLQARAAASAAVQARDAANRAIEDLKFRQLHGSIQAISPQIQLIDNYVRSENLPAARTAFESCAKDIKNVYLNSNALHEGSQDLGKRIEQALKEVSNMLGGEALSNTKKNKILGSLRDLSGIFSSVEAKKRYAP